MDSKIVNKLNEVIASISSPMTQINKGKKVAEIKRRLNEIVCSPTVVSCMWGIQTWKVHICKCADWT